MDEEKALTTENGLSQELQQMMSLGDVFFKAGIFKDIKSAAAAAVKIIAGKEMGLTPIQAMNGLYIVNDRIGVQAQILAAKVRLSGKYDYDFKEHDSKKCALVFYRIIGEKREVMGESIFTFEDAARAGIINKDVWKNYPKNMLFNRALSNGVRFFCPEIAIGYIPEELEGVEPKPDVITMTKEGEVEKNG